jgi:hypothetical protein
MYRHGIQVSVALAVATDPLNIRLTDRAYLQATLIQLPRNPNGP